MVSIEQFARSGDGDCQNVSQRRVAFLFHSKIPPIDAWHHEIEQNDVFGDRDQIFRLRRTDCADAPINADAGRGWRGSRPRSADQGRGPRRAFFSALGCQRREALTRANAPAKSLSERWRDGCRSPRGGAIGADKVAGESGPVARRGRGSQWSRVAGV